MLKVKFISFFNISHLTSFLAARLVIESGRCLVHPELRDAGKLSHSLILLCLTVACRGVGLNTIKGLPRIVC